MENAWWWILGPWQIKGFELKTHFFAKNALFSKINVQAPNMSKHISRNRGATIKPSRKTARNKVFYFGAKRPFFPKKWCHHKNKVIALNLYIGTNVLVYERWLVLKVWYTPGRPAQCFCHYMDSLMHVSQQEPVHGVSLSRNPGELFLCRDISWVWRMNELSRHKNNTPDLQTRIHHERVLVLCRTDDINV